MAVIRCSHCGASVEVIDPAAVHNGHGQSSGCPREWVIVEDGHEVHRCREVT
jgi:hypothetical protein